MSNNNTEEEVDTTTTTTNNNDDDDDADAAVTTSSSCPPHSNWSKDKLTGKSVSFKGLPVGSGSDNSGNSGGRTSLLKRRSSKQAMAATPMEDGIHPQLWGRPGHLTDAEADVYVSFLFYF